MSSVYPTIHKLNPPPSLSIGGPVSLEGHENSRIPLVSSESCPTYLVEGYESLGPDSSSVNLSLHSSTHSLIQQETGDPFHESSHEYVFTSSISNTSSLDYLQFIDEPSQRTRSQETPLSEVSSTGYSAGTASSGYCNSPVPRPGFAGTIPRFTRSYSGSSMSASLNYFPHSHRYVLHRHMPKNQHFSHQSLSRQVASNSVAPNVHDDSGHQELHDPKQEGTSLCHSSHQQEQLFQRPRNDSNLSSDSHLSIESFTRQPFTSASRVCKPAKVDKQRPEQLEVAGLGGIVSATAQMQPIGLEASVTPTVSSPREGMYTPIV